jgi:formate hydrogenlyase subunit 6/NADH:ubiquinone oxidoreductase subunit I
VGGLSFLSPVLEKLIRILPVLDEGPCTSCGRCGEVCGKAAIELRDVGKGGKLVPVIDKKKCISCFCCQEMCPEGALRVQAGVLARWLGLSH